MILKIKTFRELTTRELYEILRLRAQIFIVEQEGIYQDLDGIDYRSVHLFFEDEETGTVEACLRLFSREDEPGTVQLGRIVTLHHGTGLGTRLMEEAFRVARERFSGRSLYLTGRRSALGFYEKCGFHIASGEKGDCFVPYFELRRSL